jgi:phosphinothricin acetyltransferase
MKALRVHLARVPKRAEERRVAETVIRDAQESDAESIAAIYAHHVLTGTASYDVEPPSVVATRDKIWRIIKAGWPFLVAEINGQVVGYAYVTQFRDRPAYRYTAEDSIYVDPDYMRRGVGKALLEALLPSAEKYGFRTVIAVVGGAEPASIALHKACGFNEVGRLRRAGFKFGRWLDNIYMQIDLREADET